jgi:hypothetical protein
MMLPTMGFGTLYVHVDGDVDETKSEIEKLKKKRTPETKNIWAVRKLDVTPQMIYKLDQPNIMIEFKYDKDTNLAVLEQQVSGISGVRIIKSLASL